MFVSMAWADAANQPFTIVITQQGANPCSLAPSPVTVQDGHGVMSVFDVSTPGFREIAVRLDHNAQITGAPFVIGDQVVMTGRWDGQMCVATSVTKQ